MKKKTLLTFQIDHFAGSLQRPHSLLVRGVQQLLAVHRQDGVAHVQSFGAVGRHAAEYLRDEDGHSIFAAALDRDTETVVVGFDDANLR